MAAVVIWSVAGPVIKYTLNEISPFVFLTYRFGLSAIISGLLGATGKIKLPKKKANLWLLLGCGLIGNTIALGLLFVGLEMTAVLDMSIIQASSPLFVGLMGIKILKDKVTKKEKSGTLIALAGTLLVVLTPLGENGRENIDYLTRLAGNLLILAFVLADSLSAIIAKVLTHRRVKPAVIANYSFVVGFITTLPIAILINGPREIISEIVTLPFSYHLGVWYMAILSGSVAYWIWMNGQKTIEASEAALFKYLTPVFTAPIAILWLKEQFTTVYLVGAAVIGLGVMIAEYKPRNDKVG